MAIKIVMGPACAGKSTFIKETFPQATVIDLFNFQKDFMSINEIMQSYIDCKDALISTIKEGKDVVLEHTLLKAKRRPMYIDAIREITDEPINIYVVMPDSDTYLEFSQKRKCEMTKEMIDIMYDTLEIPTLDEGFSNIYIIKPQIKKQ